MPTAAIGTESVGYFTTGYWNAPPISFEFSLDAVTWSSTVTVLGGAISQEWGPQYQGKRAVGTVKVTPTLVGTATFMMRVKLASGEHGPFSFVDVTSFQAVANFPAISIEVSTNNSTWTTAGNGINLTTTSDGGLLAVVRAQARWLRINGSQVIDTQTANAEKFVKFSDAGVYQWFARDSGFSNERCSVVADESGIYWVRTNGTTTSTLTSANGTTTSISARLVPREWVVCKLTNAGVWDSFARISWSSSSGTGQPISPSSVAVGGGRLVLGITANPNNHTITYGNNMQTRTVTSTAIRAGALALDTSSLAGVWDYIDSSSFQGQPGVAIAADGRAAVVTIQGSTSTARAYRLQTYDTAGTSQGFITITAPGGYSSQNSQDPQVDVAIDGSRILMIMTKTGSSSQNWSSSAAPWAPLTVPAGNHSVWWMVDRGTQMRVWEQVVTAAGWSQHEGWAIRRTAGGDFVVARGQGGDDNVYRVDGETGTFEWTTTSRDVSTNSPSTASTDVAGVLFVNVNARTGTTEHLVDADGTTITTLTTGRNWIGCLNTNGQWGKRASSSGIGGTELSAPFSADWPLLELVEDTPFTSIVQGFDPELSPGAASLQVWDPRTDEWIDNPTSFTPEINGAYPATLNITMGADIFTGATVVVTPVNGFSGTLSVLFRWKIVDDAFQTRFGPAAEFVATWLSDAPTAPTGFAPTLIEEDPDTMIVSWTDPTVTGGAQGKYDIYLSEVEADGENWRPKSWSKADSKHTDEVKIEVTSLSTTALEATLTITPKKNKSGAYLFAVKVKQLAGDKEESPFTVFEGTITNLPDIPEITGRFDVFDPDGDSWDLDLSPWPGGPWSDCVTLDDGTKLCVDGNEVVVVEKGSSNRYVYYVRATDSTGQVSQPKRVIGFHGNGATGAYPQRIIRTAAGVVTGIEPLFFLFGITALRFEEGLDGVGYAEITVASDQLKRRAEEANTSVRELLDPLSVEIVVTFQGQPVFVGPITEVEWESARPTTYITARGLLHYFDNRVVKVDTEYEEADLSDIAATIAANSQSEPWGGLGIGTDTTNCETLGTLSLTAGTTALDALTTVAEKLDGPEVWVDPATRTLRAKPTRGTDQRSRVRITSGVADLADLRSRGETVVTVARVVGADDGSGGNYEAVFASTSKLGLYGRVERNYSAPQLTSAAECGAVAQRIVESRQQTTPALTLELTVTPQRNFTLLDLGVGDVITVDVEDATFGRILGDYRIVNRAAELVDQADGTYKIRLNVEPAIYIDGRLIGSRSRFNPAMATEITSLAVNQRRG
jgi:hypothetical protein